jgi:hypothetical protein
LRKGGDSVSEASFEFMEPQDDDYISYSEYSIEDDYGRYESELGTRKTRDKLDWFERERSYDPDDFSVDSFEPDDGGPRWSDMAPESGGEKGKEEVALHLSRVKSDSSLSSKKPTYEQLAAQIFELEESLKAKTTDLTNLQKFVSNSAKKVQSVNLDNLAKECSGCKQIKYQDEYSQGQYRKAAAQRRCLICVDQAYVDKAQEVMSRIAEQRRAEQEKQRPVTLPKNMTIPSKVCSRCGMEKDKTHYSINQWNKQLSGCKSCVLAASVALPVKAPNITPERGNLNSSASLQLGHTGPEQGGEKSPVPGTSHQSSLKSEDGQSKHSRARRRNRRPKPKKLIDSSQARNSPGPRKGLKPNTGQSVPQKGSLRSGRKSRPGQ